MRWLRAFPTVIPPGRPYVADGIERAPVDNYDYRPALQLAAASGDDLILLDWDIALAKEDRDAFALLCASEGHGVAVAPYRLYPESTGLPAPVWAHRSMPARRWVSRWDSHCDLFGFGCVYLPHGVIRSYLARNRGRCTDTSFSEWHYQMAGPSAVPIFWEIRAAHLHYE